MVITAYTDISWRLNFETAFYSSWRSAGSWWKCLSTLSKKEGICLYPSLLTLGKLLKSWRMLDSTKYSTLVNVRFSLEVLFFKFSFFDKYLLLLRNHPDQFKVSILKWDWALKFESVKREFRYGNTGCGVFNQDV